MHYIIDTTKSSPEIEEYDDKTIKFDLDFFEYKTVSQLDDPDFRVFETLKKAEKFLSQFEKIKNNLDNSKICLNRKLPCILYKRRYIIQSLMKLKNCTYRHYKKPWNAGDLINLHDQTYFLTVKIKKITEINQKSYRYDFELP